jgi:hypothetical protein
MSTSVKTEIIAEVDVYDGWPMIHIRQDDNGQKYYCHCFDQDGLKYSYVMVPVSDFDIEAVTTGAVTIRSILDRETRYLLEMDHEDYVSPHPEPFPEDWLPKPDVRMGPQT